MKAVLCTRLGPPEALEIAKIDDPVPGRGEVVVAVQRVGLNFFDLLIIDNKYQFKPDLPFSPGAEFAGEIEALGEGVDNFAVGERVMGYIPWGTAREKIKTDAARLVAVPDGLDPAAAAAGIVTYGTTLHGLRDRADLRPGETLLVLGASGGVGQAAIEIGKLLGARVIAAASNDEKLAFCEALGADDLINYTTENLKQRAKALTNGQGVDVIYDPVGGDHCEQALRAIAWQGRFLVIGFASGSIPRIPLNLALLKGCQILGVFWGSFVERSLPRHRANMSQIAAWCAAGRLKPHIHKTFPLAETPLALREIADRRVKGKVIIEV